MPFLSASIRAFKWKKFFQGVTEIRADVINLFYKGVIYEEENYVVVKHEKVYFRLEEINACYTLDDNVVGQVIFKNTIQEDMKDVLKRIAWSGQSGTSQKQGNINSFLII